MKMRKIQITAEDRDDFRVAMTTNFHDKEMMAEILRICLEEVERENPVLIPKFDPTL